MIRDGINTGLKHIRRKPKSVSTSDYETDFLESVATFYENYEIEGNLQNSRYIRDPYGISLILDPIGVKIDDFPEKSPKYGEITCKEYYFAVLEDKIDEILPKMTRKEQLFCDLAGKKALTPMKKREVVRLISEEMGAERDLTLATWDLQPDPDSIAFALGSPRAVIEGVTPAIGVPLKFCYPSHLLDKVRFPCVAEKNIYDEGQMVHVHKTGSDFFVYDIDGRVVDFEDAALRDISSSFVVEGAIVDGKFRVWDLLCWNDVWLHVRPLAERLKMLWRFFEWDRERWVVRSQEQLSGLEGECVVRNLNSAYDPLGTGSHIFFSGLSRLVFLKVGGRKGRTTPHLLTKERRAVFEIGVKIEKEDWGDVVEVNRDGVVIKNWGRDAVPDSWDEVEGKLGLLEWEDFQYMRPKVIEWPEAEKN